MILSFLLTYAVSAGSLWEYVRIKVIMRGIDEECRYCSQFETDKQLLNGVVIVQDNSRVAIYSPGRRVHLIKLDDIRSIKLNGAAHKPAKSASPTTSATKLKELRVEQPGKTAVPGPLSNSQANKLD
jgi:hypothetical protein